MKKNTLHILLICFCIAFLSLAGVSCSGDVNEDYIELKRALNPPVYSVNFEVMNWAYKMKTRSVVHGDKLGEILPHLKNEETSRFFAWYTTTGSNYDEKDRWYADYPVTRDMTLYGRFFKKQTVTVMLSPTDNFDEGWVTVEENQTGDAVDPSKICHEGIFKVPIGVEFKRGKPTKDSFTILHSYVADNERSSTNYTPIASKAHDYDFEGWYLLEDGDTEDKAVRQDGNLVILTTSTLIAKFKPKEHTVNVKPSAENSGTFSFEYSSVVSSDLPVASFTNLTSGTAIIVNNEKLTCNGRIITAVPVPGYKFSWWSWKNKGDSAITTSTSAEIKVPSVSGVSAVFESVKFDVSVTTSPTGTPMGIVKRTDGSSGTLITDVSVEKYPVISGDCVSMQQSNIQTIEIKAVPSAGYEFSSWCIDRGFGYERLTDGDLKITKTDFAPTFILYAEFKPSIHDVKVTAVGKGTVNAKTQDVFKSVTTGTHLIVTGSDKTVLSGTNMTVTATPTDVSYYYFDGWYLKGANSSSTDFLVTNTDFEIEARFKPITYKLSFNVKVYKGDGLINKDVAKVDSESLVYDVSVERPVTISKDTVTITSGTSKVVAKAVTSVTDGYGFDGWYIGNTKLVDKEWQNKKLTTDTTLTARFSMKKKTLTLKSADTHWGTVSATNAKFTAYYEKAVHATDEFGKNSVLHDGSTSGAKIAEAVPKIGYLFDSWYNEKNEKVKFSTKLVADSTWTAKFVKETYTVNVFTSNTDDELGGWLSVDGGVTTITSSSFTDVPFYDKSYSKDNKGIAVSGTSTKGSTLTFNGKTIKAVANCGAYNFECWYVNGKKVTSGSIQITTDTNIYACYKYNGKPYFTVAKGKIVDFADGNLVWNGSAFTMEKNAYSTTGYTNGGAVGLFFWEDTKADAYSDKYRSGSTVLFANLPSETKLSSEWRVLTSDEWNYVLNISTSNNARKDKVGYATVAGVGGMVILPDIFTDPKTNNGSLAFVVTAGAGNTYDAAGWKKMQDKGAVFLPCTGARVGESIKDPAYGKYWTSTPVSGSSFKAINFKNSVAPEIVDLSIIYGCAIRLAKDMPN